LNKLILREVEIPGALITITEAEVAKDLSRAVIKVSAYPSEKGPEVFKVLEKVRGRLQFLLGRKMNIRPMPQIAFKLDLGPEKAAGVEKALLEDEMK
jgi:ribosome-binding factor A